MASENAPDDVEIQDDPVEAVEQPELEQLRDQLSRARADYANLEKRVTRDAATERERVRARVLEGFLGVFEFARMAQVEADKTPGPLAQGVSMLVREFERTLQAEGVHVFGIVGEPFDSGLHEAVSAEDGEVGVIVRVVAPGYRLGEKVLRYAKVVVGQ